MIQMKAFYTYISRPILQFLQNLPYLDSAHLSAYPLYPNKSHPLGLENIHRNLLAFIMYSFYQCSDLSINQLMPTGPCIRGIIHRLHSASPTTTLEFFRDFRAYADHSPEIHLISLLVSLYSKIKFSFPFGPLINDPRFSLQIYQDILRRCYPECHVTDTEEIARWCNTHKKEVKKYGVPRAIKK